MIKHIHALVVVLLLLVALVSANPSSAGSQSHRNLIINGTKAIKGRYPYFVSLNHLCGGALIAPDIVLTAGHCKGRNHVFARVGTYSFHHNEIKDYDYEEIRIIKQIRHPSFVWLGDDEFVHDFLLFKLKHPSSQPTIKLNRHLHIPSNNQEVVAMGMGNTNPNYESKSNILMDVSLNVISNDVCEESYDMDRNISYAHRIHPSMLCTTGGKHNERDACAYDSGSPIIIRGESIEDDVLVALVSWGEECADAQFPGVNSRISDAYDWIRASVCAVSHYPPDDMCNFDDDNFMISTTTTTNHFGILNNHNSWFSWLCQGFIIVIGVICASLCIDRFRSHGGNRWRSGSSSDPSSPNNIIDEMTNLKRHQSWTKMRSYDSTDSDKFPTADSE